MRRAIRQKFIHDHGAVIVLGCSPRRTRTSPPVSQQTPLLLVSMPQFLQTQPHCNPTHTTPSSFPVENQQIGITSHTTTHYHTTFGNTTWPHMFLLIHRAPHHMPRITSHHITSQCTQRNQKRSKTENCPLAILRNGQLARGHSRNYLFHARSKHISTCHPITMHSTARIALNALPHTQRTMSPSHGRTAA